MGTRRLGTPSLVGTSLDETLLDPARLIRISAFDSGEPYFGSSRGNRFDSKLFQSAYCGLSLEVAIAETVLHDEVPIGGFFSVAPNALEKFVHTFRGDPLRLLDLTGPLLMRLGGNADLSGPDYTVTQQWAEEIFKHSQRFDGFLYKSRLMVSGDAALLFDRSEQKFRGARSTPLRDHPQFATMLSILGIQPI